MVINLLTKTKINTHHRQPIDFAIQYCQQPQYRQNKQNDKNSLFDNFFDKVDDTVNNNDYVSEIEKKSFNSK